MQTEIHPFGEYIPSDSKYLILGSFVGRRTDDDNFDWFYGTKRNQFWKILEEVYEIPLVNKKIKKKLCDLKKIALADIIFSCKRKNNSNLDMNLVDIVFNKKGVQKIFKKNNIKKVFFTSRFVELSFKKNFKFILIKHPNLKMITLPSPSPRYAVMSQDQKIKIYKKLLPK